MHDVLLLTASVLTGVTGMAWLALAMEVHWAQVCRQPLPANAVLRLRILGGAALLASLVLCLLVDHASMAALVWVMALTAGALTVALLLTWRPHWLVWLAWGAGVKKQF